MRHGLIILLITTATLISALAVRNNIRETARRKREIGYTVALKAYSQALHPGMTRKDVEGYLRSRNTQFTWIYTAFGGRRKSQYADVVKIGEEAAPWYCSEAYVHIALEFSPVKDFRQTDSDVLQRIEIYSRATLPVLQRLLDDKLAQIQYDAVIGIAQYAMSFPVSTVASKPTDMATFTPPKSVTDEMRLHYPSQGLCTKSTRIHQLLENLAVSAARHKLA